MSRGMSGHQSTRAQSVEWTTPPEILAALGPFDDDVCRAEHVWDGLSRPWNGRVWCNPPYGSRVGEWLEKLAAHGTGTALVFARTETRWFQAWAWRHASAMLFLAGRLHFYRRGIRAEANAGAPSVLIAYGGEDSYRLACSGLPGAYLTKWEMLALRATARRALSAPPEVC